MAAKHSLLLWFALCALVLSGCQNTGRQTVYSPAPLPVEDSAPLPEPSDESRRARIRADMLYDARLAFEDNRLMSPAGNNAYDRYREVLSYFPDNAVAQQGIVDIVLRYIQLADVEISQGDYDNAASLLARGASVLPERAELAEARARLAAARANKVETYALNPDELSQQTLEIMTELAGIAQRIRSSEATFLINARTDEEGRWIYRTMRESLGGYRLRGNIDISGTPTIIVTVPETTCVAEAANARQGSC
jgi:multidrug efflux pump subunit AcrA (membrane-fusion protein)